jgi:hypothetical protein
MADPVAENRSDPVGIPPGEALPVRDPGRRRACPSEVERAHQRDVQPVQPGNGVVVQKRCVVGSLELDVARVVLIGS